MLLSVAVFIYIQFQLGLVVRPYYLPRSGQVYEPLPLPVVVDTWLPRALALRYDFTDAILSC